MVLFLFACTAPTDTGTPPTDGPHTGDTDVPADTDDTDVPADTDPPPFVPTQLVCDELPPLPTTFTLLPQLGPHEDFAFDATGGLVGADGLGNLVRATRDGQETLMAPNLGEAKGTRFMLDGSVAIAQPGLGVVSRVMPDGQAIVLASITASNGIGIDLHGNVWAATSNGRVERVTPDGDRIVAAELSATSLDGIAFSPDYRKLYFNSEFGRVHVMDIDENFDPIGEPSLFANVPLNFSILDGMTTDSCGNVYVARMDGRVFRFLPDGTEAGFIGFQAHPGLQITPAINFGSGEGGFERDHLYAMNFLGGVLEADIGIEGRWEPHYAVPQ